MTADRGLGVMGVAPSYDNQELPKICSFWADFWTVMGVFGSKLGHMFAFDTMRPSDPSIVFSYLSGSFTIDRKLFYLSVFPTNGAKF